MMDTVVSRLSASVMGVLLLLLMLVCTAVADHVKYKDCGSTDGTIKYVDVSNCPSFPCQLKRGTNATFQIQFTSKVQTSKVTAVVHGIIASLPVPFPLAQPDGCQSGIKCPVSAGDNNIYKQELFVKAEYPQVKVVLKWELKDDKTGDLACVELPVAVV